MRNFLLLGLTAATIAAASAFNETPASARLKATATSGARKSESPVKIKRLPADVLAKSGKKAGRIAPKRNALPGVKSNSNAKFKAASKEGYVLYENFSDWDGTDPFWVPEGWTVDHKGECDRGQSWIPSGPIIGVPDPVDGRFYYSIDYSSESQDEWFISPEVEPLEGMQLTYWMMLDPFWFYSTDNIDWDTYEYIGDKQIVYTLQILVQEEGGEWEVLRDYAEEYKDWSCFDLMMISSPTTLEKQSVSLAAYADKKIKVAFRYVGSDGNLFVIDAIGIGYPALEDVSYMNPLNTLYWGLSHDVDMSYLTSDYVLYPVYAPLTWSNYSGEDATYSWQYCDPATGDFVTSDDQWELNVTYAPDYSTAASKKNNLFYPPTLSATAEHTAPGSYTAPYKYFQAGGRAEITTPQGELDLSLLPFGINEQGLTRITVMDDDLGAMSIPVFGHDQFSDAYWLNYTLNGYEALEGNYSHLIGIANIFYASEDAPLVVNGMDVYGWGRIADDAELTATIYALDGYSSIYEDFTVVARATIKGSDIVKEAPDGSKCYLYLPFKFDEPAVIKADEAHPVYAFMLEGFNSDKVEYFAPLQSENGGDLGLTFGYILNEIDLSGHVEIEPYYSFKSMSYKEYGEFVDPEGAFAIGIDGEYPWLTTEVESLEITSANPVATAALGSYYDGSRLTVEAPEGLTATVEGRYDECVLTVVRDENGDSDIEGDIIVKGPGVEVVIPVKAAAGAGVSQIVSGAAVDAVYDLAGRKVEGISGSGMYIVRYTDGNVRKVTVK